jgi:two-component sensor histidine kinase
MTRLKANVPVEVATTVGVIIAELIVNASKHAWPAGQPGRMEVVMRRLGAMIELEFSDDGQGLPLDVDLLESEGLGLKLIRLQVRRLKGRFSHRTTERGASFLLSFPLPEAAARPPEMAAS